MAVSSSLIADLSDMFTDLWFYGHCTMPSTRVTLCDQQGKLFHFAHFTGL